jgi:hypothetical protein
VLQQRDAERKRLAGSGPRLADDVVACQRDGEGERLDGESGRDAFRRERGTDGLADAEVAERGAGRAIRVRTAADVQRLAVRGG